MKSLQILFLIGILLVTVACSTNVEEKELPKMLESMSFEEIREISCNKLAEKIRQECGAQGEVKVGYQEGSTISSQNPNFGEVRSLGSCVVDRSNIPSIEEQLRGAKIPETSLVFSITFYEGDDISKVKEVLEMESDHLIVERTLGEGELATNTYQESRIVDNMFIGGFATTPFDNQYSCEPSKISSILRIFA